MDLGHFVPRKDIADPRVIRETAERVGDAAVSPATPPKGIEAPGDRLCEVEHAQVRADRLAAEHPEMLAKLQRLWLIEATKYNVLPLDDRVSERLNPELRSFAWEALSLGSDRGRKRQGTSQRTRRFRTPSTRPAAR